MGLFSRLKGGRRKGASASTGPIGGDAGQVRRHLAEFASTRDGLEAYIEPATTVTPTTLLLVAGDGEWTRRPVPSPQAARDFAARLGVDVYDVNLSGYPSRMREWNAKQKAARGDEGPGTTP